MRFGLVSCVVAISWLACAIEPSALESEVCDPALGVDACGAGLFCAAFDERTVPTCYPVRSREVGETCKEDDQCVTRKCVKKHCEVPDATDSDPCARGLVGPSQVQSALCNPAYGVDACGAGLFCAAFDGRLCGTCYPERRQFGGDPCAAPEHCANLNCVNGICAPAPPESPCLVNADCASRDCSCQLGSAVFAECCRTY